LLAQHQPFRKGGEVDGVGTGRQQRNEAEPGRVRQDTRRQFLVQVPPNERVRLADDLAELVIRAAGQKEDPGRAVEYAGVDLGELIVHRVADRHQQIAGHRGSLR
jgi:hypothetical protein